MTLLGRARRCPAPGTRSSGPLEDEDARVRAAAIGAVAGSAGGFAGLDLGPFASDPSPLVRAAAIVARAGPAGPHGRESAAQPIRRRTVRAAALGRLDVADDPDASNALIAALGRRGRHRPAGGGHGARDAAGDGRDVLAVLTDGGPRAQLAALIALGRHRGERPVHPGAGGRVGLRAPGARARAAEARLAIAPSDPARRDGVRFAGLPRVRAGSPRRGARGVRARGAGGARRTRGARRDPPLPRLERPRDPRPGHRGARVPRPIAGSRERSIAPPRGRRRRRWHVGRRGAATHGR